MTARTPETGEPPDKIVSEPGGEAGKFGALAGEWWDPDGAFRPLHAMTPCRLRYAVRQIAAQHGRDPDAPRALEGLRILDIGCGGGLLCEPMARLGATVTGADPDARTVAAARRHARGAGLDIDYRVAETETLRDAGETFDAILNMEVVEHAPRPQDFLTACAALLRPGGIMIVSTLNRTLASRLFAIVGAEYILRWLPVGTHDWSKFVTPDELRAMLRKAGIDPVDCIGFVFNPLRRDWGLDPRRTEVNYAVAGVSPEE